MAQIRVPKTKWVILRYPSPGMAQLADMSTEAFEDYYFNVCTLDYAKMDKAMNALKALMERTDRGAPRRTRHRPALFNQGPARHQVRGSHEHSGW